MVFICPCFIKLVFNFPFFICYISGNSKQENQLTSILSVAVTFMAVSQIRKCQISSTAFPEKNYEIAERTNSPKQ